MSLTGSTPLMTGSDTQQIQTVEKHPSFFPSQCLLIKVVQKANNKLGLSVYSDRFLFKIRH